MRIPHVHFNNTTTTLRITALQSHILYVIRLNILAELQKLIGNEYTTEEFSSASCGQEQLEEEVIKKDDEISCIDLYR